MVTSSDGSSSAARGAQSEERHEATPPVAQQGFWGRLLGRTTPSAETSMKNGNAAEPVQSNTAGLGNLRSMRVEDVAIPKVEIAAVPADISRDDLIEVFRESGFTRLPVYDGTLDNPLGLVHLKDIALRYGFGCADTPLNMQALLRPLIFAPPSMPIGVLLGKMQSARMHMALVIDEYGGVDGLLTIEDLIEQVLGEIEDEHDQIEGALFREESTGCWLAAARTPLDEFEGALGMSLIDAEDQEDIDTLGGLVFMLSSRVPARGEVIRHPAGVDFEVIDADARRIKRLRVRKGGAAPLPTTTVSAGSDTARRTADRGRTGTPARDSGATIAPVRIDAAE